jgi:LysR family hydrogen peroxide-inducible transcriptional activator
LRSEHGFRRIALIWRRSSPREREFQMLAESLRSIVRDVIPGQQAIDPSEPAAPAHLEVSGAK